MFSTILFLGMIGAPQIILIVVVVLLLFGGRKIPELMKGLGSGIKEFKKATKEDQESDDKSDKSNHFPYSNCMLLKIVFNSNI